MRAIILSIVVIFFASCTAQQLAQGDPWVGRTKAELLRERGIPDQTYEDGSGGVMLSYTKRRAAQYGSYGHDTNYTTTYYIDKSGKIYDVVQKMSNNDPKKVRVELAD